MSNEGKKSRSPACACGKGDLYEDWIKLNEDKKEEVTGSTNSSQTDENNDYGNNAGKEDQKPIQTKD